MGMGPKGKRQHGGLRRWRVKCRRARRKEGKACVSQDTAVAGGVKRAEGCPAGHLVVPPRRGGERMLAQQPGQRQRHCGPSFGAKGGSSPAEAARARTGRCSRRVATSRFANRRRKARGGSMLPRTARFCNINRMARPALIGCGRIAQLVYLRVLSRFWDSQLVALPSLLHPEAATDASVAGNFKHTRYGNGLLSARRALPSPARRALPAVGAHA